MIYVATERQSVSRIESLRLPGLIYCPPIPRHPERRDPLAKRCQMGASVRLGRGLRSHGLASVFPARCADAGCLYMRQEFIYADLHRRGANRFQVFILSPPKLTGAAEKDTALPKITRKIN